MLNRPSSQNYDETVPLLVIFHDPYVHFLLRAHEIQLTLHSPELMGIPHPVTGALEPHNTWLVCNIVYPPKTIANAHKADEVKDYVGWGVEKGFGVIDVNIPKHISQSIGVSLYFRVEGV